MPSDAKGSDPLARRRKALIAAAAVSIALAGVGLVAASFVKSPAQVAAEAAPPVRTVLTAVVEERMLSDTVILRGEVRAGTFDVTPTGGRNGERPVVTGIRTRTGSKVSAGHVLIEVAGRPLFALPGRRPMFRDMLPGSTGRDVGQLQKALRSLGFGVGADAADVFGPSTKAALARFYDSIGYEPVTVGEEEVEAARQTVKGARRALEGTQIALRRQQKSAESKEGIQDARREVRFAREDLKEAEVAFRRASSAAGPMLPLSEAVFLPTFPARVQRLDAAIGADAKSPTITLASGVLRVYANLNPSERPLVKVGLPVRILSEEHGVQARGTLTTIGDVQSDEMAGRSVPLKIRPRKPLPPELAGQPVRVTIEAASTETAVLVVPLSAVSAGADGRTTVTRLIGETQEQLEVVVGLSGDGYAGVRPIGSGVLSGGDQVVVGR